MAGSDPRSGRPNVLVIDDDPEMLASLAELFTMLGCDVRTMDDLTQAPAVFLEERFDLITLDCEMPGLNSKDLRRLLGEEFSFEHYRRWQKRLTTTIRRRLTPILLVTAHDETPDVAILQFAEGVTGVVGKPFHLEEFRLAAEVALEHFQGLESREGTARPSPPQ